MTRNINPTFPDPKRIFDNPLSEDPGVFFTVKCSYSISDASLNYAVYSLVLGIN